MTLADLLPQPPWLGPPLPRGLNLFWPWVQGGGFSFTPESTYDNEEIWEWVDFRGRQRKITVTRHAKRR